MMIVELVDGDDFRAGLRGLGIEIAEGATPDECACRALEAHRARPVEGLEAYLRELDRQDVVLPEVRQAIARHLGGVIPA
ncbi:hypothetical protein [Vreelandella malpeensis]|uniref:Uncharacterized protein n=1 Tax=Vreelandella malpeensis TaxID=1172368 RepID=A0ABS8DSU6_9GAMM|nr:hypothetical protein [Halomonas malpeensis]MCB8889391.1 hypothetical protein [Halomonas malpeensis]